MCQCPRFWTGPQCKEPITCRDLPCKQASACHDYVSETKKICKSLCMHAMIHPINQPCRLLYIYIYIYICMWPLALFVTSRSVQPGGYYCTCEPGWTGPECSIDVDECSSDPCRNGGICIDQQNSYYCQCLPGYTGNHN